MPTLTRARRISAITMATLAFAVFSGCDDARPMEGSKGEGTTKQRQGEAPVAAPDSSQQQAAEVLWSRRIDVIGQPVDAGRAVLVLARAGGDRVELVSLDRRTGRRNFATPFHPGGLPTGVAMTPKVTRTNAGRYLAVVRRNEIGAPGPALVAMDVTTGRIVASTDSAIDDYDACSDGTDVCWSGYEGGTDQFGPLPGGGPTRWDIESGRLVENDGQEGARMIGTDLYFRGDGRTSTVSRLKGGQRTVWTQSASLAVAPGVNPDYGWSFERDKDSGVYVGSLGRPFAPALVKRFERGKRVVFSYRSRYLTVGIDGRTGEQLWRRPGANSYCPLLPSDPTLAARVLCVVGGSSINEKGAEPRDKGLTVELRGIEPQSGEMVWTRELTQKAEKLAYSDNRAALAPFGVVLASDEGPVALDMRTGDVRMVDQSAILFCDASPETVTVYGSERSAGALYRLCTPDGRSATGPPSQYGVSALASAGDTRVVSLRGRVVAYGAP